MLFAIAALLLFQLIGETISRWLNGAVPGALIGMALLLIALCVLGRTPKALLRTSNGLLAHLMLLFIPAVVAVMTQTEYLASEWLPFIVACIGATALTILATAATLRFFLKRQDKKPQC